MRNFTYQAPDKSKYKFGGALSYGFILLLLGFAIYSNDNTMTQWILGILAFVILLITLVMIRHDLVLGKKGIIVMEDDILKLSPVGFSDKWLPSIPLISFKGLNQIRYDWIDTIETKEHEGTLFIIITIAMFERPVIYRLNSDWFDNEAAFNTFLSELRQRHKTALAAKANQKSEEADD